MLDRQLRLSQRAPAQVSALPLDYVLSRGGIPVDCTGELSAVYTGGLTLVRGIFTLIGSAPSGDWTLSHTLSAIGHGVWIQTGSATGLSPALFVAGMTTTLSTLPGASTGDLITIQGVL